jgi:uncharacterized phage protein (TIGR02220 family)/predicted phage replisome organizer
MADVKWIRICTNMINNKKIKRIRTMPEGNNIVLIWVFLIAQAGESNRGGGLFLTDTIPFTHEDLAVEFGFEIPVIQLALITLEKFSMIEVYDDVIYIKNWEEYQNSDGLEKIREQGRERARKFREKKKQELLTTESNAEDNVTVTLRNATEEELELERDINTIVETIEYLNLKCGTNYKAKTAKTRDCVKARINEGYSLDDLKTVIDKKHSEWFGSDMQKYLRPQTLFGTNFESYLNQLGGKEKTTETRTGVIPADPITIERIKPW